MKSLFLFLVLLAFAAAPPAAAAPPVIKLTWNAPAESEPQPTGYNLWRQHTNGTAVAYTLVRRYDSTERLLDITTDGPGTYALSAFNEVGESDVSEPVVIPRRPGVPLGVRVVIELQQ